MRKFERIFKKTRNALAPARPLASPPLIFVCNFDRLTPIRDTQVSQTLCILLDSYAI